MRSAFGTDLARQSAYVPADPERGRRIADAFEAMPDDIDAPGVREAYERLAEEVEAQYQAAMDMGLEVSVITPDMPDPYPNGPRDVLRDLQRGHMWVYPTDMGFGTLNEANADSPMLRPTRFRVGDHVMLVNDLFRVVHDVFGHGREGVGFGPAGEENTWQSHVRMFSPQAARAMTTETRGQNSWVNYGPYGEQNRTNPRETVFADQKLGLLPEWASEIDVAGDADPVAMSVGRDVQEASWLGQRGVARLEPEQVARIVALAADRTGMRIGDTRAGQGGWFNPDAQQIELEPSTVTDVMPADDVALRRFASVLGYAAGQWSVLSVDASPRAGAFNSIVVRVTAPEAEGLFEDRIFELARDVAPDVFSGFAPVRGEGSTGAAMAVSMDDAAPERIDAAVEALARRLSDEGYEGVEVGAFPANADFHEGGADGGGYAAALRDIDGADPEPILRDVREAAGAIFEAGGSQDPVMQAVDVGKLRADLDLLSGRLRSENEAALAGRLREAVPALPDLAIRQLAAAGITPRDFRYVQRDPDGVHMEEQARWVWRELPSGEVLVISTRRREGRDVLDDAFVANAEERAKIGAPEREVATTGPRRRRRADTSDPLWSGRPARRNPAELNVGDMRPFRSIDVTQTDDFMRTPEQDVGLGPAVKRTIARVRSAQPEAMSASMRNLEQQLVNQFAPIRDLELRATGRETLLPGMDSAFKAAEIAMNDSGRVETLLHQGAAAYDEYGAFAPAKGTIGLIPMLQKLGDGQAVLDWMHYMAARRAQRLNGRGIKTPLSQADIAAGLAKETPLFREVAADWKAFNDANIDFAVDSGLVARKAADAMKRDDTYIPFYRVDERDPDDIDPAISGPAYRPARGINNPKSGIRAIKGGETLRLNNLIENMVMNSKTLVSGSMRNNAALKTADLLTMAGEGRVVSPARAPSGGLESGVLTLRRNGEEMKLIASDPAMVLAMAGLRPQQMDSIQKFMADVASFFRQGITLSPAFMVRNLIRGAVSTGILTGKNIGVQHNTFTGMARALRNTREAQAFKAQAGMADYRFGHQETGLGKNDVMIDLGLAPATAGYRIRKLISAAEGIGSATELADRIALRENLIRQGVRPDEASYQALNIINYGRKGANAQLQYMLPLIPFLNARIQGLARLAETPSGERNMRAAMLPIALRGSVLAAASALLWGWNNEDDEKRARYEAEPLHRRLNYHLVYAGDTKILIPKAFELGVLFGTIPELMLEATVQGDMEETGPALTQTLINTLSFNPMPAAVLPALEVAANYNFFTGRPLESLGDQSRMREDRIDYRTTAGSVELADTWLASMLDLSPIEVQHLLDGYGGIYANVLLSGLDTVAADMGLTPKRPEGAFGDLPVVSPIIDNVLGSMVKDADVDAADRYLGDFYDTKSAVSRIVLSARDARTIGDVERARELLAEFPTAPRAYKLVNSAGTKLSELNKEIKNIRRDLSMGAAAKANALRPLIARRKQLAYDVSKLLDELEDRQRRAFSDAQ